MHIFKVTHAPLWCISYSLEISGNSSWTYIQTLWPSITHCFYSARQTQPSNSCSVVETLIKSLFVFSVFQQLQWVSLYTLQRQGNCVCLWCCGCTYRVLRLAQDEICPPRGRCRGFGSQGRVVNVTARFGKWEISPALLWVLSSLPQCCVGRKRGAEPCPCWTRAGGTAGDINRRESVDHSFLLTWLQSLSSCTEGLKDVQKRIRLLTCSPHNTYTHITLARCTKPHRTWEFPQWLNYHFCLSQTNFVTRTY